MVKNWWFFEGKKKINQKILHMYSTAFLKFSLKISALCVLWLCQPSPGYFRFATQFLNYSLKFPPTAVVLCNILLHIFKIQSLKYESGPLSIYQNIEIFYQIVGSLVVSVRDILLTAFDTSYKYIPCIRCWLGYASIKIQR